MYKLVHKYLHVLFVEIIVKTAADVTAILKVSSTIALPNQRSIYAGRSKGKSVILFAYNNIRMARTLSSI
jgi:uncharacterized protein VirK/YbjX